MSAYPITQPVQLQAGPGVLESWSPGVLESWSLGVLESWSLGVLESWSPGVLESWSPGVLLPVCQLEHTTEQHSI